MPPWREIYRNDEERKQDFAEAVASYDACVATYREFGYEPVDVPRLAVPGARGLHPEHLDAKSDVRGAASEAACGFAASAVAASSVLTPFRADSGRRRRGRARRRPIGRLPSAG